MATDLWARRLFHFNIAQILLNSILLFLLSSWFFSLPEDPGTNLAAGGSVFDGAGTGGSSLPLAGNSGNDADSGVPPQGSGDPSVGSDAGDPQPGTGGPSGPPPSAGQVGSYLASAAQALRAAGAKAGVDISPYQPSDDELRAAVGTGDFFNPKTLSVLRKMKQGFEIAGATLPPIPEELPPEGSFP